jgi:hypothetical protein
MHSAASALQLAGADVVAAVPVGRLLDPEQKEVTDRFMARARAKPFSFRECCLEGVDRAPSSPWSPSGRRRPAALRDVGDAQSSPGAW